MAIPEPFNTMITSLDTSNAWLTLKGITLSIGTSNYSSRLGVLQDSYLEYITRASEAKNQQEVSKVASTMIQNNIRAAAPLRAQLYMLSKTFIQEMKVFMETSVEVGVIDALYNTYKNKPCNSADDIKSYLDAVAKFRSLQIFVSLPESQAPTVSSLAEVRVGDNLAILTEMIIRMKKSSSDKPKTSQPAGHAQEVKETLLLHDWQDGIPVSHWTGGFFMNVAAERGGFVDGVWSKQGRMMRVSTGLASLMQSRDVDVVKILDRCDIALLDPMVSDEVKGYLDRMLVESKAIATGGLPNSSGGGFSAQCSNIDPVFFTFYLIFKRFKLSIPDFYLFQTAIYKVCLDIRGKKTLKRMLDHLSPTPGISELIRDIATMGDIHTAPWIFNLHRIYDMAAVIGGCDARHAESTITKQAISWRYFLNINYSTGKEAFRFLCALWQIEDIANKEAEEDIRQSEKMLQQLLMGRNSPLECTNFITGNSLNCKLLA